MAGRTKFVTRKRKEEEAISSSVSVEDSEVIIYNHKCVIIIWKILTMLTILKNKLKSDT